MTTKPPIVSLLSYRLHRLLLENLPEHDGDPSITVESGVVKMDDDSDRYALRFVIRTTPPAADGADCVPRIEADMEGFFRIAMDGEPEEIDTAIRVFGGAQLYSLLRGLISSPAALFSLTTTVLPTLNMQNMMAGAKPLKKKGGTAGTRKAKRQDKPVGK